MARREHEVRFHDSEAEQIKDAMVSVLGEERADDLPMAAFVTDAVRFYAAHRGSGIDD